MFLRPLIQPTADWLDAPSPKRAAGVTLTAFAGLAVYGFTVGYWRDPLMGFYVAVKMPPKYWPEFAIRLKTLINKCSLQE